MPDQNCRMNSQWQQELALSSAPSVLLFSYISPHNNKCLQWKRKVKKTNIAHVCFHGILNNTHSTYCALTCTLKCKLGLLLQWWASTTVFINPALASLNVNKPSRKANLYGFQSSKAYLKLRIAKKIISYN